MIKTIYTVWFNLNASVSFIMTKCSLIWHFIASTTHLLHLPFPQHFTYRFRHYWLSIIYLLKIFLLILNRAREALICLLWILEIDLILWVHTWRISIWWMIILTNRWSIIILIASKYNAVRYWILIFRNDSLWIKVIVLLNISY